MFGIIIGLCRAWIAALINRLDLIGNVKKESIRHKKACTKKGNIGTGKDQTNILWENITKICDVCAK